MNGSPVRSCSLPVSAVTGAEITTIEGAAAEALRSAWVELQVPQCGYCQSGQRLAAHESFDPCVTQVAEAGGMRVSTPPMSKHGLA